MPAPFGLTPTETPDLPPPAEIAARLAAMKQRGRPFGSLAPQSWETGLGKIGSGVVQGYKDYLDPFAKDASGQYVADTPAGWTPNAAGKMPEKFNDPAMSGALLGLDVGSNFIGGGAGAAAKAAAGVLGTRIVSPAIRVGGRVHFGINHAEALEGAAQTLRTTPEALLEGRGGVHRSKIDLEGFVDDKGNYLNRAEAAKIADNAGQTPWEHAKGRELVAEDLDPGAEAIAPKTRAAMQAAQGPAFLKNVKPSRENIADVLNSNFIHGRHVGNRSLPLDKIETTMSASAEDAARVKVLTEKMKGPDGYWERPIVDDAGNVVEGQHRINALRATGYQGNVPVTLVRDAARGLPVDKMAEAIRGVGATHSDHVNQIIGQTVDMIHEAGSPAAVLRDYEFPAQFHTRFEAALKAAEPAKPQLRVAAQEPGGAVHVGNPGEVHAELIERHGLDKYPERTLDDMMGWVGPDGKFMDRGAAYDWYRANVDSKSKILNGDRGGGLLTDDIPNEAFGGVSPPRRNQ